MSAPVTIISEWDKNAREVVRVSLDEFNGVTLVNIRAWFRSTEGGSIRPTKSGIAVTMRQLPKLAAAVDDALRIAIERGDIEGATR